MSLRIFGEHGAATIAQLRRCAEAEDDAPAVLCADGHLGYSMPIGGVVGYRHHISPSGVGSDIACGNLAVRSGVRAADLTVPDRQRIADEITRRVSFGMGRANNEPIKEPCRVRHDCAIAGGGAARIAGHRATAVGHSRRRQPLRGRARGR